MTCFSIGDPLYATQNADRSVRVSDVTNLNQITLTFLDGKFLYGEHISRFGSAHIILKKPLELEGE